VYYPVDPDPASLCAATAVYAMLEGDPQEGCPPQHPLFRDPDSGDELTYVATSEMLRSLLLQIGADTLAAGLHSLRRGGATAVANDTAGGALTAGFMRHWASDAKYQYMYALRQNVERAALSIGHAHTETGPLALRPGPVSAYATGHT